MQYLIASNLMGANLVTGQNCDIGNYKKNIIDINLDGIGYLFSKSK